MIVLHWFGKIASVLFTSIIKFIKFWSYGFTHLQSTINYFIITPISIILPYFSANIQNNDKANLNPNYLHVFTYSLVRICLHDLINILHHYLDLSENICTLCYFLLMTQLHRFASISSNFEFYLTEITYLVLFVGKFSRKIKKKKKINEMEDFGVSIVSFIFPMLTSKILRKLVSCYFLFKGIQTGINSGSLRLWKRRLINLLASIRNPLANTVFIISHTQHNFTDQTVNTSVGAITEKKQ